MRGWGCALDYAQAEGIACPSSCPWGNKADLNETDFLAYLLEDPQTDVILMYLEDLTIPGGSACWLRKAVHSANPSWPSNPAAPPRGPRLRPPYRGIGGSDVAYDALFASAASFRVESLEELFDYAAAFATQPLPKGTGRPLSLMPGLGIRPRTRRYATG